eukprot:scaffold14195_cov65-Cyclotella_meneghiniana.AAC.1
MKFPTKKKHAPSLSPSITSTSTVPTSNQRTAIDSAQRSQYPNPNMNMPPREPSPRNTAANHDTTNQKARIISLSLENSSLKSQLASLLDSTDASSYIELTNLLTLANEKNDMLQNKVDELHAGFKEIEKERRLLKSSVENDRMRSMESQRRYGEEIEAIRSLLTEESKRVELLRGELAISNEKEVTYSQQQQEQSEFLKMREKELAVLQSRVKEQERRILVLKKQNAQLQAEMMKLETDCAGLVDDLENRNAELSQVKGDLVHCKEREAGLISDLADAKASLAREQQQRDAERQAFEIKVKKVRDESNTSLEEKEVTIQTLQNKLTQVHHEMEQMSTVHEEIVTQKDGEIQLWKEQKQTLDAELAAANKLCAEHEKENQSQSNHIVEVTFKCTELEKENDQLTEDLHAKTNIIASLEAEFERTREQVHKIQQREADLENELAQTKLQLSHSQDSVVRLNSEINEKTTAHQNEIAHVSKCNAELETELAETKMLYSQSQDVVQRLSDRVQEAKTEMAEASSYVAVLEAGRKVDAENCDEYKSSLEKMQLQLNQNDEAHQCAMTELQKELEVERSRHFDEVEMLKSEYSAQVEELETNGAAVIADLEESIRTLKKEVAHNKTESTKLNQAISQAHTEKELLERQVQECGKRASSQDEKVKQLSNLSQHRGEEIIVLQKELTSHRDALDLAKRDHSEAITTISRELDDARLNHQRDTEEMLATIDNLRSQLVALNDKLESKDAQIDDIKSKLDERTQLLKDMVTETKVYKANFENECSRANKLSETIECVKLELNEARSRARHYEQEKTDSLCELREAFRKERQQRKAMAKEIESFDAIKKRCNEMEKENAGLKVRSKQLYFINRCSWSELKLVFLLLKDKISRQENYIGKLHDKQATDRRRSTAPLGTSKANRPSAIPVFTPPSVHSSVGRGSSGLGAKKRIYVAQDLIQGNSFSSNASMSENGRRSENDHPKGPLPQSVDKSDLIMG